MKQGSHLTQTIYLAALIVLITGCASSPPVRFYALTPLGRQEGAMPPKQAAFSGSVSIAPVEIPAYLDRPQIVTRQGRNQLQLAEFDQWAGSLSDNISAVLAENVATFLGSDRVSVYPEMRGTKYDFAVAARILRLDCLPGDRVLLKAHWIIVAGQDRRGVATRTVTFTKPLGDKSYETLVAALSLIIDELSREIARDITAPK